MLLGPARVSITVPALLWHLVSSFVAFAGVRIVHLMTLPRWREHLCTFRCTRHLRCQSTIMILMHGAPRIPLLQCQQCAWTQ